MNVALQTNGGVATASSTCSASFPPAATNDGDRQGLNFGAGGGWNDNTSNVYPDWLQITFSAQKSISEIDVFTLQDNYASPVAPTATLTFSKYGITAFDVQYWNGSAWVTVPGGSITGNNLVWRQITFPAVTTNQIRVVVNGSVDGMSRITEVEAYSAGSGNAPPSATITAPVNGAVYSNPAAIVLSASASDSDGTVTKVEFYNGSTLLGSAAAAPYSYTLSNVAAGSYILKARAYDNLGATTDSAPVTVTVIDTTAPTVSLTTPNNAATVSGSVTVSASASDNVAVSRVEFYLNGVLVSTASAAPYSYIWNTSTVVNGSYTWSARAYDAAGNVGQSGAVSVTVANDTTPPTVSLTAPSNNATVSGTVTISASASDNVAVSRVEFYLNGLLVSTDSAAPYSCIWNTSTVVNGSYTWSARAYDAAGNVGQSGAVSVTVANDTTPPTASLTAPGNNATVSGTVAISANASDNVAVSRVEFYQNGTLLSSGSVAPYSYSWNTTTVANGAYTLTAKAYDAAGNVGQSANIAVTVNNQSSPRVNVALQANGGVATASSTNTGANFTPAGTNNGDRKGLSWGAGGGWNDNTFSNFPDWLQITFSGQKSINEIDVFTIQDNYANPVDPTATLTFNNLGITAFDVQYWTGTAWMTVSGGSITGNNLVWRKITFPALTTSQIRVVVNGSVDGWSRITEIEAYTP